MITLESYINNIDKLDILDEGTLENGSIMMMANEGFLTSVKNKIKKLLLSIIRGLKKLLSKGKDNKIKRRIVNLLNRAERSLTKCDRAETNDEIKEVKKETDQIQEEAKQVQEEINIKEEKESDVSDNNGDKIVYQRDGKTISSIDKPDGTKIYYHTDGKTIHYIKKPDGTLIWYQNDGKTIKYITKPDGTMIWYQNDGKTIHSIDKPDDTKIWYQKDGKTIHSIDKPDGTRTYYQEDGKTIHYIKKPDGTRTYYQKDGKTINYIEKPDGTRTYYQKDTSTKKTNNRSLVSIIKKYVDAKDKKSIMYIFADSLDVDPTFVQYQEAYNYVLHNFPEAFEENKDLTPFENDPSKYNLDYYVKLKYDFKKNPSKERFQQMRKVAKVANADKVKRLIKERSMKKN